MTIKINNIEIEATPTETAEFVKLFSGEVKKEPAQPKPKKAPANKKDLDVGKMKALKNAGWSIEKIADEMKLSRSTVYRKLQMMV